MARGVTFLGDVAVITTFLTKFGFVKIPLGNVLILVRIMWFVLSFALIVTFEIPGGFLVCTILIICVLSVCVYLR